MPGKPLPRHSVTQPLDASYRLIPLTRGKTAIVDVEDFAWLSQWNWCAYLNTKTKSFYASRSVHGGRQTTTLAMHREILKLKRGDGQKTDHKNHDTLDNRKQNLRKCATLQNGFNRKKHGKSAGGNLKGVTFDKSRKSKDQWRAQLQIRGKHIHLGWFPSKEDAARAYDEGAKKYFGEFAHLNFPTLQTMHLSQMTDLTTLASTN